VHTGRKRCHPVRGGGAARLTPQGGAAAALAFGLIALALGPGAGAGHAAGPPTVVAVWSSSVFSSSARLSAQINPNGVATGYHFEYLTKAAYDANLAASKDGFDGAARAPVASNATVGSGSSAVTVFQPLSGLSSAAVYRYRVVTSPVASPSDAGHTFATQASSGASILLDNRGWEMVSPVDKNGGEVEPPGALAGGGVLQAASQGGALTYGSRASFAGGQGAPPASQYLSTRTASGWGTQNVNPPIFSSTYDFVDGGVPYRLFSGDLARAVLLNGDRCRGDDSDCAVANPPLAGTDAPAGYQNYYLRDNGAGTYTALLGNSNAGSLDLAPADFEISFASASADLNYGVLSSCAALTANATEVPSGSGCDPAQQNLYEYSPGGGLTLINLKPGDTMGTPGAALAAQSGAVSDTGNRVYWNDAATGNLYMRKGSQTEGVDLDAGGGGSFQAASNDGSIAFFTVADHLWRFDDGTGHATDLTPSGGVVGVLGASALGDYAYYQDGSGLQRWHNGSTAQVAAGADAANASDWPPTTGTARVSADGTKLLFVSSAYQLSGYDNTDQSSPVPCGQPSGVCDSEVYLYDATGAGTLTCVSCNPTNERPVGPSSIPGASANGTAPGSTDSYKPRALSANGRRAFFDSRDAIAISDINNDADAYEWEAQGEGSCASAGGCVSLVSAGRAGGGSSFADASADGSDAFFLTGESLVKRYDGSGTLVDADPGGVDLYDARVGGGFPVIPPPIICTGDSCQPLPPSPTDPTLTTRLPGLGNPPLRYVNKRKAKRCKKGFVKRKGRCVRKHKKHRKTHHKRVAKRHHKRGGRR
jgi:hypothetical protein